MDENRSRGSPRLQFSKEELENDALSRPIQKAEKAADRVEQVKKKARLQFESDAPKPPSKLSHEVKKAPGRLLSEEVHRNIRESEDENVGIQAAHGTEQAAETALHMGESAYHAHKRFGDHIFHSTGADSKQIFCIAAAEIVADKQADKHGNGEVDQIDIAHAGHVHVHHTASAG